MIAGLATARRLMADDSGATAIEYALLAAFIATMIITAVMSIGGTLSGIFVNTNSQLVERMQPVD